MKSRWRSLLLGFGLVFGGIMAANLGWGVLTPGTRLLYPVWVVLGLVPAYWFGCRIGAVSFSPWEILGLLGVVLVAVAITELWSLIRPLSALTLALLMCALLLIRRRVRIWTRNKP